MQKLLPISEKENIKFEHFPTAVHAVVFRLWNMVPCRKIAQVLCTSEKNIYNIANDMGLGEQKDTEQWITKGYITIIKALWHIMPYEQIMQVLDWDRDRLAYVLKEDDFLGMKLGGEKPKCEKILYRGFTSEEKKKEKEIAALMNSTVSKYENVKEKAEPFDFFNLPYKSICEKKIKDVEITSEWSFELLKDNDDIKLYVNDFKSFASEKFGIIFSDKTDKRIVIDTSSVMKNEEDHEIIIEDNCIRITGASAIGVMRALYYLMSLAENAGTLSFEKKQYKRKTKIKSRIIYSFCSLYSDVLDVDSEVSFPEKLLKEYAKRGINGVWIQAVMYKLVPFKYDEKLSIGWEKRIENLNTLIKRARRYGIKVYFYINEPRSMPDSFFEKYPHIKGHDNNRGVASMCTSTKEVQKYVHDTFVQLATMAPGLGGFWNICMSENLTHCYSKKIENIDCPRCSKRKPYEVAAEITSVMVNAVHSVDKNMKFFVHSWAFEKFFNDEEITSFINMVPKGAIMVGVSECRLPFEIAGVKNFVRDYSMSRIGPSEWAKKLWKESNNAGLESCAKIQVNTTWECSTAPFLPVYENVISHIFNLQKENIEHLFLSWTLGGYISDNLEIASSYFFSEENSEKAEVYNKILSDKYGAWCEHVKKAVHYFCKGFSHYPFDTDHIYVGPSNSGTANLFFEKETGHRATMTGFPYDDTKRWGSIYGEDILLQQYEKVCAEWEKGLKEIENMPVCEFRDMAYYGYSLFKSSLNQLKFYKLRNCGNHTREMLDIIKDELELSKEVYKMMVRNAAIGYEAANQYYVCKTMVAEKFVQCTYLINKMSNKN